MRQLLWAILLFIAIDAMAQTDNVGAGRAIQFNGVDGYVNYGDIFNDLTQPFTISAWVYLDPSSYVNPIFCTNDNPILYQGFVFFITTGAIGCEFGDGTGGGDPAFRRGKIAYLQVPVGRWIHACAVMTAPFDIQLYINGINVGGDPSGQSNLPMAKSTVGDVAKSGYYISNSVTYRSKGMLDELRIWNKSMTQSDVQIGMCKKLSGSEPGLIGYWNFDEVSGNTVYDHSPNGFNGQLVNSPTRVYSGAPIGDDSKYQYSSNWTGTTLSLQDNTDLVSVNNIQGNPEGIHIYEVKNAPSQTGSLGANATTQPYFGIFAASLDTDNYFDATYTYQGSTSCKTFSRADNSLPTWSISNNPITHVSNRDEIIRNAATAAVFDLGPDKILCNQTSSIISTGITDPQFSISWNTGEITSSINVTQSGKYVANVSGQCGTVKDSVLISFEEIPPPVSLGEDQSFCPFKPVTLVAIDNSSGYQIKWQDNSGSASFQVKNFGKYWVSVKNDCGSRSDTITISQLRLPLGLIPNVITPNNGDHLNQYFKIDESLKGNVSLLVLNRWGKEVYKSDHYQNDWDGGSLSSGVYFIVLTGPCIDEVRGSLTILH